jgi:putative endonuclease
MSSNEKSTTSSGKYAEENAISLLKKNGFQILTQNFRYGRYGEIDISAQKASLLIFVEVRSRNSYSHGGAAASVNSTKKKKIINTARFYLQQNDNLLPRDIVMRFDVIALHNGSMEWIEDAFRI